VVLDDDYGVAFIDEAVEDVDELVELVTSNEINVNFPNT